MGPRALIDEAAEWVHRLPTSSLAAEHLIRRTKASMYPLLTGGSDAEVARFVCLFGQLHETVARSSQTRGKARPFRPEERPVWKPTWIGGELALAGALAGLSHSPDGPPALRPLLTRCTGSGPRGLAWSQGPPRSGVDLAGATLSPALAAAHQHRLWEVAERAAGLDPVPPAGYATGAQSLPGSGLVMDFLDGLLDDHLLAELLRGLLILGWRTTVHPPASESNDRPLPGPLATLLPFYGNTAPRVRSQLHPERAPFAPRLRPRPDWANRLRAGHVDLVLADARSRLRQAHCPPVPPPPGLPSLVDGTRLAAALLIPVHADLRARALTQVSTTALLPLPTQQANYQDTRGNAS